MLIKNLPELPDIVYPEGLKGVGDPGGGNGVDEQVALVGVGTLYNPTMPF